MAGVFEPVEFEWRGKKYALPADRILATVAKVEDVVTLTELLRFQSRSAVPLAKLARAFALVLTEAGAETTADEVYAGVFREAMQSQTRTAETVVAMLFALMCPPASLQEGGAAQGKPRPAEVGAASSKRSSRRRSGRSGAPATSSGA